MPEYSDEAIHLFQKGYLCRTSLQPHPEDRERIALVVGLTAVVRHEAPMSVYRDSVGVLLVPVYETDAVPVYRPVN